MIAAEFDRRHLILEPRILDLKLTLSVLLDQVVKKMSVDAARVYLCDAKNKDLRFVSEIGFNGGNHNGDRVQYGESLVGYVALRRRPFIIVDLTHPKNTLHTNATIEGEGFIFYCGIPLLYEGCLQGVMELFCRQSVDMDSEWIGLLIAQAEKVSVVIDDIASFDHIL